MPRRKLNDSVSGGAYSAYSNRMLSGDYHKRESVGSLPKVSFLTMTVG